MTMLLFVSVQTAIASISNAYHLNTVDFFYVQTSQTQTVTVSDS